MTAVMEFIVRRWKLLTNLEYLCQGMNETCVLITIYEYMNICVIYVRRSSRSARPSRPDFECDAENFTNERAMSMLMERALFLFLSSTNTYLPVDGVKIQ